MLDKFLKLFKKKEEGDNKKKIENLIFILVLLIITVVAINYIWKEDEDKNKEYKAKENIELVKDIEKNNKNSDLSQKLEDILSNINGVR